jgi:menaquinone-dependent protoporphyrinogen oxidase
MSENTDDVGAAASDAEGMMNVLVTYSSKHGSTAEIAQAIASTLGESGLSVDCRSVDEVRELDGYDAVVLGSALYAGRWRGDARHFLRRHKQELAHVPLWVFSTGPVGEPREREDTSWLEPPRTVKVVERLGARDHVVFGGRVPPEPHGFVERAVTRSMPTAFADCRDWEQIREWSARIASELGASGDRHPETVPTDHG